MWLPMNTDLNALLNRLREAPPDHRLDQFEPGVWARIDAVRREAPRGGVWGWRAALAAVMLSAGAMAGGVASAKQESSPFAIHSSLAPSTLLEEGR
jgi:hypothetical protein